MISTLDYSVFKDHADKSGHAFGSKNKNATVTVEDREKYWRIYENLNEAANAALKGHEDKKRLFVRRKNYSRERGSRGHRPVDLWVSICAVGAEAFGHMPQIYAIASQRGLEIGFAASIAEDDYFDPAAKERNRTVIPFINSKLPQSTEDVIVSLDQILIAQGGWYFNSKTRLTPNSRGFDQFGSLAELLNHLHTSADIRGGGVVAKIFSPDEIGTVDLSMQFSIALHNFAPLLSRCAPSSWDIEVRTAQDFVNKQSGYVKYDPISEKEGRERVWAEVARRQGQAKFRRSLLEAYDGKCAISGTNVADVLQAAHIIPYNGPKTNHVTNGILLRADLHNLFDLKLIAINPVSKKISVSTRLCETEYWKFNDLYLKIPVNTSHHPCSEALAAHFFSASSKKIGDGAEED